MRPLEGVYHILATPFSENGDLDRPSLARLVDAVIDRGVDGIVILGVAGESHKLTAAERLQVVEDVMAVSRDRVKVIVGASQAATMMTTTLCRQAEEAGAAGVMIAPPTFLQPGRSLTRYYADIGHSISLPIVLQDYPPVNGVQMSPRDMAELVAEVPSITTIKLEDAPTPLRIAQTRALTNGEVSFLGGLGGMYILDELRQGSRGAMTGFAFPEILVDIWQAWSAGDIDHAAETYAQYLPLLVFEGQPKIGLAIRKHLLTMRGFIDTGRLREPAMDLPKSIVADLEDTLRRLNLEPASESH